MAISLKCEKNPEGGVSITFEDKDGSGDLDRMLEELCEKHKREGTIDQAPEETMLEILQAIGTEKEAILDEELNTEDID